MCCHASPGSVNRRGDQLIAAWLLVGTNLIHGEKCVISRDVSENMPNFTENSRKEFQKFTGPTDVISRCYANAN